jgi:hypothetical protein
MSEAELMELVCPQLRERFELVDGLEELTTNIRLSNESAIVRSIHSSLSRGGEFAIAVEGKNLVFWRPKRARPVKGLRRVGEKEIVQDGGVISVEYDPATTNVEERFSKANCRSIVARALGIGEGSFRVLGTHHG